MNDQNMIYYAYYVKNACSNIISYNFVHCFRFPVAGSNIRQMGIPECYYIGKIMIWLKQLWFNSNFVLSKDQLLNRLDTSYLQEKITLKKLVHNTQLLSVKNCHDQSD